MQNTSDLIQISQATDSLEKIYQAENWTKDYRNFDLHRASWATIYEYTKNIFLASGRVAACKLCAVMFMEFLSAIEESAGTPKPTGILIMREDIENIQNGKATEGMSDASADDIRGEYPGISCAWNAYIELYSVMKWDENQNSNHGSEWKLADDKWADFLAKDFMSWLFGGWCDLTFDVKYSHSYPNGHDRLTLEEWKIRRNDPDANSIEIQKLREFADALSKLA